MTTKTPTTNELITYIDIKGIDGWDDLRVEQKRTILAEATGKRNAIKLAKESVASPTKPGSVISKDTKAAYGKEANCGDLIAILLKDAVTDEDSLKKEADANGIDASRWDHLNFGMQRMNLGNVLRGMTNTEKAVTLGGKTVVVQ